MSDPFLSADQNETDSQHRCLAYLMKDNKAPYWGIIFSPFGKLFKRGGKKGRKEGKGKKR